MLSEKTTPHSLTIPLLLCDGEDQGILQGLEIAESHIGDTGKWPQPILEKYQTEEVNWNSLAQNSKHSKLFIDCATPKETQMAFTCEGSALNNLLSGNDYFLMVRVGLSGLAGGRTIARDSFHQKINGWCVSGNLSDNGLLTSAKQLAPKLNTLYQERRYWCDSDQASAPISKWLLPESNREEFLHLIQKPGKYTNRYQEKDGAIELFEQTSNNQPWLTIYFAHDFSDVLEIIFGQNLISEYQQKILSNKQKRISLLTAAYLTAAAVIVSIFFFTGLMFAPAVTITRASDHSIDGKSEKGEILWNLDFEKKIITSDAFETEDGKRLFYVTTVEESNDCGSLYVINQRGKILFEKKPVNTSDEKDALKNPLRFEQVLAADVHPTPGNEIMAVAGNGSTPSKLLIYSENGKQLASINHPGSIDFMLPIPRSNKLFMAGTNPFIKSANQQNTSASSESSDEDSHSVAFCLDISHCPEEGELPPFQSPALEDFKPDWYYSIHPGKHSLSQIQIPHGTNDKDATYLMVHTKEGYRFRIEPDGTVTLVELDFAPSKTPSKLRRELFNQDYMNKKLSKL